MKVSTGSNGKKYVDLEGGGQDKAIEILVSNSHKSQCFTVIKFIFYLEIFLFVGLLGFMALETYLEKQSRIYPVPSANDGFDMSDSVHDISTLTTTIEAELSTTDDPIKTENMNISHVLLEMNNKLQKLVDTIDKLSDSDNSDREFSKYRDVSKAFISNENDDHDNSHENYNSRVFNTPVEIAPDVSTNWDSKSVESFNSPELTQESRNIEQDFHDEPTGSELPTKILRDLVDGIDIDEDVVSKLRFDDVFQVSKSESELLTPREDLVMYQEDPESGEKQSFEESYTTPEDDKSIPPLVDNTEEDEEAEASIVSQNPEVISQITQPQLPYINVNFGRSESSEFDENTKDLGSDGEEIKNESLDRSIELPPVELIPEEYGVSDQNDRDSNLDDYNSEPDMCDLFKTNIDMLFHLGLELPPIWSKCVNPDRYKL